MRLLLAPALSLNLLAALALPPQAHAGGGPERTVVVVNADSPISMQVAHEYARLRAIPASHLIYVEGVSSLQVVDLPTFRARLWTPVVLALVERGLLEHTDLLAWSADFPFAVDVAQEAKAKGYAPPQAVPLRASLTGLTYLWRHVAAEEPARYLHLHANRYFHAAGAPRATQAGRPLTEAEGALAKKAQAAIQRQAYEAARDAYLELVAAAPDLMAAWYDLACCHARLGALDLAMQALTNAVERGWADTLHTLGDPDLEALRRQPAFDALLERMNRRAAPELTSHGFRPDQLWNADGSPVKGLVGAGSKPPDLYLLSVMLGCTGEWGNSAPEVLDCLARGAASDGTRPDGTVYLLAHDDVRADTREPFFPAAIGALERLGRKAAVLTKGEDGQDGILPKGKTDVIGLMLGTAGFSWAGSQSTLLPGAIAEHLTSFGADFTHGGQTKLSELIRAGSAGSSGAVAEPLAHWQKFPVPAIHVHYAQGCSLAEAYYQSMAGPWQTLVVGDPLARPFARFATVEITSPLGEAALVGRQEVRARVTSAAEASPLELWVDGRFVARGAPSEPLPWDTTAEADGVHEVRVVAVDPDAIATRSYAVTTVTVENAGRRVTLAGPKATPAWGTALVLTGKAAGATQVEVLHGARVLGTAPVKGDVFRLEVDTLRLGPGSVPLVALARFAEGPAALSAPLVVAVATSAEKRVGKPPKPVKPRKPKDAPAVSAAGLKLVVTDEKKKEHTGLLSALTDEALTQALADLKVLTPTTLTLEGEIQVAADGFYQLVLATAGTITVEWAGQRALETTHASSARLAFAAAHLKAGWNPIRLTLTPSGAPRLAALLGGQVVTAPVAPAALRP